MVFTNVTFLNIKDPASAVRVESPDLSGPVDSGDSVDLQCWVQMENAQCFEEHMVWWFRSGLDQSGPGLVYTQRNSSAQCDRSTEDPGPHKCLYTFSKTMSPSDAGTYRCAVAACGHILFGNGTKVNKKENQCDFDKTIIIVLSALLTVSLIVIMVLSYSIIKRKCCSCFYVGQNADDVNISEHTCLKTSPEPVFTYGDPVVEMSTFNYCPDPSAPAPYGSSCRWEVHGGCAQLGPMGKAQPPDAH
ncbi:uncharacterized protein LOC129456572 [Periophthalmus magnuspinnatus]|uniref:uncharacterized protein LOC129456572 n=1 Tax=Periophthalmus magnuspinnatus TaxID=409849 RepID=UPI00243636FE|nr:uncharacterized protein LOC129456572 [Periophthalmus magnuspinnatus]